MAPMLVTLNDLERHSPVAGVYKCNQSNIFAAFYNISTESVSRSLCVRLLAELLIGTALCCP